MSKLTQFAKFVGHYAGELRTFGTLARTIFSALPIDRDDKDRALSQVDDLFAAAERIEASLSGLSFDGSFSRDDIKGMVKEVLTELLPDILAGQIEKQVRKALPKPTTAKPAAPVTRLPSSPPTGE